MRIDLFGLAATLREPGREFRVSTGSGISLESGQVYALTGSSGSGKTLFLELLGLLVRPDAGGRYILDRQTGDEDLAELWAGPKRYLADYRARLFGFVLQTGGLFPFLSVRDNIALPQLVAGAVDEARVSDLIHRLELNDVAAYKPDRLSVGQRQRTAVARALSHRPAFVIADEPTSALDPDLSDSVLALLFNAAHVDGAGVVVSTHDPAIASRFSVSHLSVTVRETAVDGSRTESLVAANSSS